MRSRDNGYLVVGLLCLYLSFLLLVAILSLGCARVNLPASSQLSIRTYHMSAQDATKIIPAVYTAYESLMGCNTFYEFAPEDWEQLSTIALESIFIRQQSLPEKTCAQAGKGVGYITIDLSKMGVFGPCDLHRSLSHELLHVAGLGHGPVFFTIMDECVLEPKKVSNNRLWVKSEQSF